MLAEIIIFSIVLIVTSLIYTKKKYENFPPGPWGLPLVGYLPFLGDAPHTKYGQIGRKYGNIFSLTFGSLPIVILNDVELIRKAFRQDVFQGRPKSVIAMSITSDGISFNEGTPWYQQRKFTLKGLRDLGFGKTSIECTIHEEVKHLIDYFMTQTNKPISLKHTFEISVINTLWSIVASKHYALDDPEVLYMHKICYEGFIEPEVAGPVWFMPWLAKLAPDWTGFTALKIAVKDMRDIFQKFVDERRKVFDEENMNDFVDLYLKEVKNCVDTTSSFYKEEGINQLVHVLIDLFTAGSDTTSSTLSWSILYLLHYPEVMKKLRREIDTVVGTESFPVTSDRPKMPYVEATMQEIFRMSSIVCGALLHSTLQNTVFERYMLPKGTIVMANLWQVHHNPAYWKDPENFRPERFLDSFGDFQKDETVMPFSFGKRICPAESLATTNFFLFLTALVQNFDFEVDKNNPLPSLDAKPGLVLAPQPYKVILKKRNEKYQTSKPSTRYSH